MRAEISWWQVTTIMVAVKLSNLTTNSIIVTSRLPPSRDSWISAILAASIALGTTLLVYLLSRRYPEQIVFDYSRRILGPVIGSLFNIGLTVYFVYWSALATQQFSLYLGSAVYSRTPEVVFGLGFLFLAFVASRQGLEFIGRIAELAIVLTLGGLLFLYIALLPSTDFGFLRPVMGGGFRPILDQALTPIAVFGESSWVGLLAFPHLARITEGPKAALVATLINATMVGLGAILLLGVFGPDLLTRIAFPLVEAARSISYRGLIERVEWLVILTWMGVMGIKISILAYGASLGLRSLLPQQAQTGTVVFITLAIFTWSRFSIQSVNDLLTFFYPSRFLPHALPLMLAPIVLLGISLVRHGRNREAD